MEILFLSISFMQSVDEIVMVLLSFHTSLSGMPSTKFLKCCLTFTASDGSVVISLSMMLSVYKVNYTVQ